MNSRYQTLAKEIMSWLRRRMRAAHRAGLVVGLSGGVDSAVTAALCHEAAGDLALGVIMPCGSARADRADALLVARKIGMATSEFDLSVAYRAMLAPSGPSDFAGRSERTNRMFTPLANANLKARLRMAQLYLVANSLKMLVVGTGNRSELMVGYFTLYGDGGVDLLPLGGLLKRDVRGLAVALGIPRRIIEKPPSAGLWPGQTDEGEMGISYTQLDAALSRLDRPPRGNVDQRVRAMVRNSAFKRRMPPVFLPRSAR